MEIITLRKMLDLGAYDELSFGAPDKTGWMNVEVTDVLSGDFRVVGQYKGGAFRPTGASQASRLTPARSHAHRGDYPPPMTTRQAIDFARGYCGAGGILVGGFMTMVEWGNATPFTIGVLIAMVIGGAFIMVWWPDEKKSEVVSASSTPIVPSELPTAPFAMATRTCPGCGAPVSELVCSFCGWERPRGDYQ